MDNIRAAQGYKQMYKKAQGFYGTSSDSFGKGVGKTKMARCRWFHVVHMQVLSTHFASHKAGNTARESAAKHQSLYHKTELLACSRSYTTTVTSLVVIHRHNYIKTGIKTSVCR